MKQGDEPEPSTVENEPAPPSAFAQAKPVRGATFAAFFKTPCA